MTVVFEKSARLVLHMTYMIGGLLTHELLDHGLNDRIELGLDIRVVEVPAHLILIS